MLDKILRKKPSVLDGSLAERVTELKKGRSLPMSPLLWTATAVGRSSVIYRELPATTRG